MNENWTADVMRARNRRPKTPLIFHILFALVVIGWIGFIISSIWQTAVYAMEDKWSVPRATRPW